MTQLHEEARTNLKSMSPDQFQNWYTHRIDLARQITEPLVKAVSNGKIEPMSGARIAASVLYSVLNPEFNETALLAEVQQTLASVNAGNTPR